MAFSRICRYWEAGDQSSDYSLAPTWRRGMFAAIAEHQESAETAASPPTADTPGVHGVGTGQVSPEILA
ncbi:MAG TPA: hypothetical protein VKB34_00455 [Povalibacter sp.]|nr:hypothetical protein [Povalibacter sp.]